MTECKKKPYIHSASNQLSFKNREKQRTRINHLAFNRKTFNMPMTDSF